MAYKAEYDDMTVVELITVCQRKDLSYTKGNEILKADALRKLLGKRAKAAS